MKQTLTLMDLRYLKEIHARLASLSWKGEDDTVYQVVILSRAKGGEEFSLHFSLQIVAVCRTYLACFEVVQHMVSCSVVCFLRLQKTESYCVLLSTTAQ